ncbi:MAG: nitrous oxide reductase accessory protein NosL [Bacteroidota bacterium]|nr:nitrous oxide reductase accessory protein NosL [Bacteroidota bacterium]
MAKHPFKNWIRIVLALCGIALIVVLYVPMWMIDLSAPQYPEGLRLLIYTDKLGGSVDIINGLNHYIGMKTLHTEDFIEFKILPKIISVFAGLFVLVAILRKRKLMNILFIMFLVFGIVAMADFWMWEYDYGHNLNPEAAIIVPGMAYQPPLIGFKQLLNFGAYSVPDIGGWIFVSVGILLLFCIVMDYRDVKKTIVSKKNIKVATILFLVFSLPSCNVSPEPLKVGIDKCKFCKMAISDIRFGTEAITQKGKIYKYDEAHCFISDIQSGEIKIEDIKDIYLTDYCGKHELINKNACFLLRSEELRSPMEGNVAAYSYKDSLQVYKNNLGGEEVTWEQISK